MNFPSSLLATMIALACSGIANAADNPQARGAAPQAQQMTPPTDTVPTDTTPTEADYVHGQAVRAAAQREQGKPLDPPGQHVNEMAHTQRDFMQFDSDKSGTLSSAELAADSELTANFGTLDEDGDGVLSRAEFDAHLALEDDSDED